MKLKVSRFRIRKPDPVASPPRQPVTMAKPLQQIIADDAFMPEPEDDGFGDQSFLPAQPVSPSRPSASSNLPARPADLGSQDIETIRHEGLTGRLPGGGEGVGGDPAAVRLDREEDAAVGNPLAVRAVHDKVEHAAGPWVDPDVRDRPGLGDEPLLQQLRRHPRLPDLLGRRIDDPAQNKRVLMADAVGVAGVGFSVLGHAGPPSGFSSNRRRGGRSWRPSSGGSAPAIRQRPSAPSVRGAPDATGPRGPG